MKRRAHLALLFGLGALGCGGLLQRSAPPPAPPAPAPQAEVTQLEGLRLITLPAPTQGWVHLSLWIDAGSRDAEPAQLATVSAWLAAQSAGAEARVVPDGTELSRDCPTEELEGCVQALLEALSERDVSDASLTVARRRLRGARRRGRSDPGRTADGAALAALFGRDLSAFGSESADEAVNAEAVAAFRASHYGAGRVLLVAAGDLPAERLADAAEGLIRALPTPEATRAARPSAPGGATGAVGDAGYAVVALGLGNGAQARGAALRLEDPLTGGLGEASMGARHEVRAFELRGSGVLLARVGPTRQPGRVAALLLAAAERAVEGVDVTPPEGSADPRELARRQGERWIAGAQGASRARGVAVVLAGGRGDRLSADDPDARVRERAESLARRLFASEAAPAPEALPSLETGAGQALANGARVHLERRGGQSVSAALAFEAPAAAESPVAHGRGAILARLTARTCGGADAGRLRERLQRWHVTVEPFRTSRGFGAMLTAPRERAAEAIDLLLACGLQPDTRRAALETMRAEHLAAISADTNAAYRAWAAAALAPAAPSWVSLMGTAGSVGRLSPSGVAAAFDEAAVGARVRVSIVGDITGPEALAWTAPRLGRLPAGAAVATPAVGAPGPELTPETWSDGPPRALIGWRSDGDGAGAASGARAFAAAASRRLGQRHGLAVRWQGGHADELGAWAAVVVEIPEARLDELPSLARDAAGAATEEAPAIWVAASTAARFRRAGPAVRASDLALQAPAPSDRARALSWTRRLAGAPARFVVGRQHAPAAGVRRRRRR